MIFPYLPISCFAMTPTPSPINRVINKIGIAAIALNGVIGAGIFALPAGAAQLSGNLSPWMFIVCGLLMLIIVLSFAQLSTAFSETGGPVLYAQKAFGDHVAFQTTWLLYVSRFTATAANSNAFVFYLHYMLSQFGINFLQDEFARNILIIGFLSLLTLANLYGVKRTMSLLNSLTLLKLLPLLGFVLLGLGYWDNEKIFTFDSAQITDFDGVILLIVYAYVGFEGAVVVAGESKNPTKNIAKSLVITMSLTILLYFFIQSISVSVLPNLATSKAPLSEAATIMLGLSGGLIITVAAMFSISGNIFSAIFAAPRMTYALAKNGNLMPWFSQLSANNIPKNGILFLVVVSGVLAITGTFVWLALISSLARLIGYFISIAALVKLKENMQKDKNWFLPFGLLLPILSLVICIWLASHASIQSWGMTLGFAFAGSLLFWITKRKFSS